MTEVHAQLLAGQVPAAYAVALVVIDDHRRADVHTSAQLLERRDLQVPPVLQAEEELVVPAQLCQVAPTARGAPIRSESCPSPLVATVASWGMDGEPYSST